jgi:hypothetical protein
MATTVTTSIRRRSLLRSPTGACRRWPQPPSTNIRVMIRALWLVYYAIIHVIIGNGIASVVVLPIVYGMPYAVLVNKAPKCSTIEAPSFTTLTFHYHAPGMNVVVCIRYIYIYICSYINSCMFVFFPSIFIYIFISDDVIQKI